MSKIRLALLAASAALVSTAAFADELTQRRAAMRVEYDQSAVLHVDKPVKTVLVGNADIADAQLVNDHTIYVVGRMFGNTNVIALDAEGGEVTNTTVTVATPEAMQVTLYRGPAGQRNLACSPNCERTVTQGDSDMQAMYNDNEKKMEVSEKAAQLSSGR